MTIDDRYQVPTNPTGDSTNAAASTLFVQDAVSGVDTQTTNVTLTASSKPVQFCDTSGGAFTVTLPLLPQIGQRFIFLDKSTTFGTNNLTVNFNGALYHGLAAGSLTLDLNSNLWMIEYTANGWYNFGGHRGIPTALPGDSTGRAASTGFVQQELGNPTTSRPACGASFTADVSHPTSGSLLLVSWTQEDFDTDNIFSTSSNPSRLVAQTTGTYVIAANVEFNANATGARYAQIRKNAAGNSAGGTLVAYTTDEEGTSSFFRNLPMVRTVQLTAGDYIEVFAYQNSGGALNMLGSDGRSFATLTWVGNTGSAWGNADAQVYQSTVQSIAHATETLCSWDSEVFDTNNLHDNVTSNSRLTCVTPGTYAVTAIVTFAPNATGYRYVMVRKNSAGSNSGGTLVGYSTQPSASASITAHVVFTKPVKLAVGDYIECFALQSSGSALDINGGNAAGTFSMVRVGYQTNPSNPPYARAYRAASLGQSITSSSVTKITFTAKDTDDYGMIDISGAPTKITIKVAGKYNVSGFAEWASNATGQRFLWLRRYNSANTLQESFAFDINPGGTYNGSNGVSGGTIAAAGDYITLEVFQNSGGNLNVQNFQSSYDCALTVAMV